MEEMHANFYIRGGEELGRGAFGYVEKVYVTNLHRTHINVYARKFFSPQNEELIADTTGVEHFKERFKREVKSQCKCVHDNVVPIYFHNLHTDRPWTGTVRPVERP